MNKGELENGIQKLLGSDVRINRIDPVSGGDINRAFSLELSKGERLFLKCNRRDLLSMFEAERTGLEAIESTGAIGVPKALDAGVLGDESYLLMEFVKGGRRKASYWEDFGHALAAMHCADTSSFIGDKAPSGDGGRFGFLRDNYIGSRPQDNTPCHGWRDFFKTRRLSPQFRAAAHYFDPDMKERISKLLERIDDLLVEPKAPALIHGDLWGGNFIDGDDGSAWLIDPAAYVGHPEADIAMTELFGGFAPRFYHAYRESGLIDEGYETRRDIYNLYHLLNHLNMFGGGYLGSVAGIVKRYT